jgi:hypothetical protein
MSTKMDEDDWGTRMRCSAPAWRSADGRLRTTGVSSRRFISSPSRMCAGRSAGAFRSLDSIGKRFDRLSTGRRLRGLLRSARVDELHRPSHSDVRFDRCARACVGGRSKRGRTAGRSRGGFTMKIHAKSDASGDVIAFDLTGGEASDARHFETLLDIGPDIRRHRSTKATPTKPITKRQGRAASPRSSRTGPTKKTSQPSSREPSTRQGLASSRAAAGASASSASPSDAKRPNETSNPSSASPPAFA